MEFVHAVVQVHRKAGAAHEKDEKQYESKRFFHRFKDTPSPLFLKIPITGKEHFRRLINKIPINTEANHQSGIRVFGSAKILPFEARAAPPTQGVKVFGPAIGRQAPDPEMK